MHLFYFDETKYDKTQSPFFFIGGLILRDADLQSHEATLSQIQQFKLTGKTSMFGGRPLGRLLDTIYFTHSHHSRFLQAADVMLYIACRCESRLALPGDKFHEQRLRGLWEAIKTGANVKIQRWP